MSHSHLTGSPATVNPDRSGTSGPSSRPGLSRNRSASCPLPSGNEDGSWYHRIVWPVSIQRTSRHGNCASHRKILAAWLLGRVVATASSILALPMAPGAVCSIAGIRWQLIPTVLSTVYERRVVGGRSDTPTSGCLLPDTSQ